MLLPPVDPENINGMGLCAKLPKTEDATQLFDFIWKKVEKITYDCEQEDTFTTPGETFQVWNPKNESSQNITLKPVTFEVSANLAVDGKRPLVFEETETALQLGGW